MNLIQEFKSAIENSVKKANSDILYLSGGVGDLLLSLNYDQMHKPHFKQLALSAYPDFWNSGKWYRKQDALQIISGIREWHDTLLNSKYNVNNRKAVIGIYNDIASGEV